jgi:hypothetical protein
LYRYAMAATDAAVPIAFGAGTLAAVWRCIVPDVKNCAHFLAGGGMESLLNLLQVCSPTLRPVLLSVAADILENPKTHLFFHEWRSVGGRTSLVPAGTAAATLVLGLWRAEELKLGVVSGDGVIANPTRPLAGTTDHARPTPEVGGCTSSRFQFTHSLNGLCGTVCVGTAVCVERFV